MSTAPRVWPIDGTRYDLPILLDVLNIKTAVEIGVDHGYYSYYLLKHSKLDLLWSVDPFQGKQARYADEAQSYLQQFGERSQLLRMYSHEAANMAQSAGRRFGFVYIDGDHSYGGVKADIAAWWPLVFHGGILAGHDYVAVERCGVIEAVNEFCAAHGLQLAVTREPWASWMIFKTQ